MSDRSNRFFVQVNVCGLLVSECAWFACEWMCVGFAFELNVFAVGLCIFCNFKCSLHFFVWIGNLVLFVNLFCFMHVLQELNKTTVWGLKHHFLEIFCWCQWRIVETGQLLRCPPNTFIYIKLKYFPLFLVVYLNRPLCDCFWWCTSIDYYVTVSGGVPQ